MAATWAGVWPAMTRDLSLAPSRLARAVVRSATTVFLSSSQALKARPAAPGWQTSALERSPTWTTLAPNWASRRPQ